ncbi:MAG: glycerol-3-phosphate 1-O-acyltransferase PlsY [Solobacterium sp.]|jgi:glycerol-3-phosphate acyltransferase PlsY|nr:glycerol-3-phosphate 1-O-acyltransferase PlsY [Solobacterium sp.]
MKTVFIIAISYLFGSIPWALVIGKVFFHKDIRQFGSGNLGASNAGRVLGKPVAVIVTVLDALKAFISMWIASMIAPEAIIYAGLACCIGHCFPVFAQFKGGKAVATSYGFFLGISVFLTQNYLWNFFFPVIVFFLVLYLTKIVSVSSITALLLEAVCSLILKQPVQIVVSLFLLWAFVTYRHKGNIDRIRKGTESRIKWMG